MQWMIVQSLIFGKTSSVELPEGVGSEFSAILEQYQGLLQTKGATEVTCHFIPSTGNLIRVPPRCIPAQHQGKCKSSWKRCWTMANGCSGHSLGPSVLSKQQIFIGGARLLH